MSTMSPSLVLLSELPSGAGYFSIHSLAELYDTLTKKLENHRHMVAIYFAYYNFCRIHQTLRVTPAMEAGLSNYVWSVAELVQLLEQRSILHDVSNAA